MPKEKIVASIVFEDSTLHFNLKMDGQPSKVLPLLFELSNGLIDSGRWDNSKYQDPVLMYIFTNDDHTISTAYNKRSGIGNFGIGDGLDGNEAFIYEVKKDGSITVYATNGSFHPGKFFDLKNFIEEHSRINVFYEVPADFDLGFC